MRELPLFDGLQVDLGRPHLSLAKARSLADAVVELEFVVDETWPTRCEAAIRAARSAGAHHIARIATWLMHPETMERYGYDAMHATANRMANQWLARLERTRLQATWRTTG